MSDLKTIVRAGDSGIVKTASGDRAPTPVPEKEEVLKPVAVVAKGSPPPRVNEPANAPSAFTRRGGRHRRRSRGKTQRRRRHRGGGLLMVVQDGAVWRIKEDVRGPDGGQVKDASGNVEFAMSEQSWPTAEEAMRVVTMLKGIKRATPNQEERYDIIAAGKTLVTMKRGGRRRRHH